MEASHSGLVHRLGKAAGSKGSREFESLRLRRLKLPNPKGGRSPAPTARVWAKDAVAPRRIGTGREFQNGRICHEP